MHALLALIIALAAPTLASPRERLGYDREIDGTYYKNLVPKFQDYTLSQSTLDSQKSRAKLITKLIPDDTVIDNVILTSNTLTIVQPAKREVNSEVSPKLVRQRRGYNLENVRVPARYPYLPVPNYNRFRRWG